MRFLSYVRKLRRRGTRPAGIIPAESWPGSFHLANHTALDRYPEIFSFACSQIEDAGAPNILSFGCSTGEESATLRRHMPQATVTGIDINPLNILQCFRLQARSQDGRMLFRRANSTGEEPSAFYDAIFCMAVLQHGQLKESRAVSCESLIRFEDFETMVTDFTRCLKPRGLLVIWRSNFRFGDTAVSNNFDPIKASFADHDVPVPRYSSSNMLLVDDDYPFTVFRKTS